MNHFTKMETGLRTGEGKSPEFSLRHVWCEKLMSLQVAVKGSDWPHGSENRGRDRYGGG